MTAALTNEELREIEKRHRNTQIYYDDLKEASGEPLSATGPQAYQDRAALLAHIRALTEKSAPTASTPVGQVEPLIVAATRMNDAYNACLDEDGTWLGVSLALASAAVRLDMSLKGEVVVVPFACEPLAPRPPETDMYRGWREEDLEGDKS